MKRILLTILLVTVLTAGLNAAERQPILWSIRSLGMGGAGIVVANTDDALLFNPACVSYVPERKLTINPLSAGVDQTIISEISYIMSDLVGEVMGLSDLGNLSDTFKNWVNSEHNIGVDPGANISFVTPLKFRDYNMGFGFGVYGNALANIGIGQGVWSPTLDIDVVADGIGMGTLAFDLYSPIDALNPITIGISAKYLYRLKIDAYESLFSMLMDSTSQEDYWQSKIGDILNTASGLGIDLGFLYKWCDGDVGIGLTVKNLGGLSLAYASGTQVIPQTVNFGWGCNYGNLILACDVLDVLGGGNFPKKIHAGAEYPLGNILSLRGGLSSGWPTFGGRAALDLLIVRLYIEYAYTAREIGEYAGQWGNYFHRGSITLQFF